MDIEPYRSTNAATRGNISEVEKVITSTTATPSVLCCAAMNNLDDPRVVLHVLKYVNVNCSSSNGGSPMSYAIQAMNINCLKILLKNGANTEGYEKKHTPLKFALECGGRKEYACMLVDYGATIPQNDVSFSITRETMQWITIYANYSRKCKQGVIVLMGLRKYGETILNTQPTDVIRLIAQTLWNLRKLFA
jgi:ankyrin repeat protein